MNTAVPAVLERLLAGQDLEAAQMTALMERILGGEASPAQVGALLIALRMKGETVTEIAAAAQVMRALANTVTLPDGPVVLDTCGTGGDGQSLFNVSTAVAFVAAAAGARVAKHGNRSVSSRCGSADLLETAGVRLDLTPAEVATCIAELGIGFLFAPAHHGAMRHAIGPRRELGVRTLFNLLGPLTNPAGATHQLVGVFDARWTAPLARVLGELGSRHVLVVHAEDGLDEISIAAPTRIAEWYAGELREYTLRPLELGLASHDLTPLRVEDAAASLAMIREVFAGARGPARDMVVANAAAALYAADLVPDLPAGMARAAALIDAGEPARRLERLAALTQRLGAARDG
ncbi:MAG: anthranilate phosphoribosyltransferase [Pseudomonadota bacterium]|nr:anthranilate phosphoribosyltransferase [Pseudomonadota bacterium]